MTVIFIRTLIVYTLLIVIMRLMGKRQIGQLEVTDFVTTLLISEIATLPIENPDLPIANALIPMITLLTFEVVSSTILSRTPRLKNLFSSRPGYLIRRGKLDQKEMLKNRISPDELMSELRQNGFTDLSEVAYAIIEQDGKLTVIPRAENRPLTPKDININVENSELSHIIIAGGVINDHGLGVTGKDMAWLSRELSARECAPEDVFLMTLGDSGRINIIMKEKRR
jgi:uncharacterized membrane protein YcaP (DUF421 family)